MGISSGDSSERRDVGISIAFTEKFSLNVYLRITAMKCNNPAGPAILRVVRPESAKVINKPGRPLARWVPTEVKNTPLVFFQFLLLWRNARVVFSPTLKMYFAESKVMTTVGSVSEDTELRTDALQDMGADEDDREKSRAEE
jgi:hypothetical protein